MAGVIAVTLSIIYLVIVQLLDFRGEMVPAPQSGAPMSQTIANATLNQPTIDANHLTLHRSTLALMEAPVLAVPPAPLGLTAVVSPRG